MAERAGTDHQGGMAEGAQNKRSKTSTTNGAMGVGEGACGGEARGKSERIDSDCSSSSSEYDFSGAEDFDDAAFDSDYGEDGQEKGARGIQVVPGVLQPELLSSDVYLDVSVQRECKIARPFSSAHDFEIFQRHVRSALNLESDLLAQVKLSELFGIEHLGPIERLLKGRHLLQEKNAVLHEETRILGHGERKDSDLILAVRRGSCALLQKLLHLGLDPNVKQEKTGDNYSPFEGHSALAFAVLRGDPAIVRLLMESGGDPVAVTRVDGIKTTPFHLAVAHNKLDIVKYMIDAGADLEPHVLSYKKPLHEAASCGHAKCAIYLLDAMANPNARDSTGATPLFVAANRGHIHIAEILLAHGANREIGIYGGPRVPFYTSPTIREFTHPLWTRAVHPTLPRSARLTVRCLLLCNLRLPNPPAPSHITPILPIEMWEKIFGSTAINKHSVVTLTLSTQYCD